MNNTPQEKKEIHWLVILLQDEKVARIEFKYAVHLISRITIITAGCGTSTWSFYKVTGRLIISYIRTGEATLLGGQSDLTWKRSYVTVNKPYPLHVRVFYYSS